MWLRYGSLCLVFRHSRFAERLSFTALERRRSDSCCVMYDGDVFQILRHLVLQASGKRSVWTVPKVNLDNPGISVSGRTSRGRCHGRTFDNQGQLGHDSTRLALEHDDVHGAMVDELQRRSLKQRPSPQNKESKTNQASDTHD